MTCWNIFLRNIGSLVRRLLPVILVFENRAPIQHFNPISSVLAKCRKWQYIFNFQILVSSTESMTSSEIVILESPLTIPTFRIVITPPELMNSVFFPVRIQYPPHLRANMRPVNLEYPGVLTRCPSASRKMLETKTGPRTFEKRLEWRQKGRRFATLI
jgi:hypothetical protein